MRFFGAYRESLSFRIIRVQSILGTLLLPVNIGATVVVTETDHDE